MIVRLVACALLLGGAVDQALAGDPAPSLVDPRTGRKVALEPGAAVLHLVFFATWCPTCVDELPRLGELEARWGDRGYRQVLVVVQARHTADRLARFFKDQPPPGALVFDAEGIAERRWKVTRVPTHLVLDAEGRPLARTDTLDVGIEAAVEGAMIDADRRRRGGRRSP